MPTDTQTRGHPAYPVIYGIVCVVFWLAPFFVGGATKQNEVTADLVVEYQGREISFQGRAAGRDYRAFLEALPAPSGHWFLGNLPMEGPQPCMH